MRRMYRYEVPLVDGSSMITMSQGAEVVHAGNAWPADGIEFWAEFDSDKGTVEREFAVVGTGWDLPPNAAWVKTCPRTTNGFVWHLYELR
jgi:hypothetical protein